MSTTPETPTPDHGEPWRVVSLADGGIASRDGSPIVNKLGKSHRAISCVNTCAGMADPAAEIAAMRAAIREANIFVDQYSESARSSGGLPMCPECHRIPAWDEEHNENCSIFSLLTKLKPFITPEA